MPSPVESKKVMVVGFLKMTMLIDMPSSADLRKSSQRLRSSMALQDILTFFLNLARVSIFRRLLMKCLASGIMKHMRLSLSMRVWRSLYVSLFLFFYMAFIPAFHAVAFSGGRAMLKRRVLIRHPKNVMISFNPPSAIIFRIETGSGCLIGSIKFMRGRRLKTGP